jgi:hypothetical protein
MLFRKGEVILKHKNATKKGMIKRTDGPTKKQNIQKRSDKGIINYCSIFEQIKNSIPSELKILYSQSQKPSTTKNIPQIQLYKQFNHNRLKIHFFPLIVYLQCVYL